MTNLKFRPGVTAVFQNHKTGLFLVCERGDAKNAWQFPQGGIDQGETPIATLFREMKEELGCDKFKILKQAPDFVQYLFPPDLKSKIVRNFSGQSQLWFLTEFEDGNVPDLKNSDGEFQSCKWETLQFVLDHIVDWKKESYIQGLSSLGLLEGAKK